METCFVMQPFDGGTFDKRFRDVFAPAIEAAELEPYRIDLDPSVVVPIEDIERGIRSARLCLAEITTDNPNVWYELGFAFAAGKNVILVCSSDRKGGFPFDIRHRQVLRYSTDSPSDFEKLGKQITQRIQAFLGKDEDIANIARESTSVSTGGLPQHELMALVAIAENQFGSSDYALAGSIRADMARAGFRTVFATVATAGLIEKGFIEEKVESDLNGNRFEVYRLASLGQEWLKQNIDKLHFYSSAPPMHDDDIPF